MSWAPMAFRAAALVTFVGIFTFCRKCRTVGTRCISTPVVIGDISTIKSLSTILGWKFTNLPPFNVYMHSTKYRSTVELIEM